ncbi:MATE family efflux transporter [Solimicrobium silvestre]|uniref:Multidrug-efflux transporter n=1 Tax=Solimicrobium silvestre TaxID=2099400 RepID=A0A2S9GWW1_9BURK|nr:MATE family efflux transporter [Solimicrobium silvestre]PRC92202.1 matE: MATE efflux family protein [Solimicrobium silvestre]
MRLKDTRATWHLAWPIAVGQLASTGTAFIDTVMAGHVSAGDLAAVSVGSSIWVTLIVTMLGYLLATSPLVAQKVGANDTGSISALTQQALVQALIIAALAWIATRLLLPIFPHLGLEPLIANKAADFLKAISWGLPAFALYRVLYSYSAALKHTKPMMIISVFCLLLNIPANWILIYGHLGFPAMGGVGCGWATAFCVWVNFILLSAWILRTDYYQQTHPFRAWQGWNSAVQKQLFKLGLPIGIMFLVEVSAFSFIALIIAKLGTTSVAAHQIALNFCSLTFMVPMAVGTALTVRVGHAVGAKNFEEARAIGQNGIRLGLFIAVMSGCLMIFGSHWVSRWYTQDEAVLALAGNLIVLAGIFQFSDITQVVSAGVLRGYKVTRVPMMIHMTAFWIIGMPLGYLLTFGTDTYPGLGVRGYWIALIIALTFTALALQFLFRRTSHSQLILHNNQHNLLNP